MAIIELRGTRAHYAIDTKQPDHLIQANGKFGQVFKGYQAETKEPVIIKRLHAKLNDQPAALNQFQAETLLKEPHSNLAISRDLFQFDGHHYLIRDFHEGITLRELIGKKRLSTQEHVAWAISLLEGLEFLHSKQLVHRDIKPNNILLSETESGKWHPILLDLGLCLDLSKPIKKGGKTPFSMIYSPPEQLLHRGWLVQPASDLYSLSMTLYECLTGSPPFHHAHPVKLMNLQINYPLQEHRKVPKGLFEILAKAGAKHAFPKPPHLYSAQEVDQRLQAGIDQRFPSATDFRKALENWLANAPTPSKRWKFW